MFDRIIIITLISAIIVNVIVSIVVSSPTTILLLPLSSSSAYRSRSGVALRSSLLTFCWNFLMSKTRNGWKKSSIYIWSLHNFLCFLLFKNLTFSMSTSPLFSFKRSLLTALSSGVFWKVNVIISYFPRSFFRYIVNSLFITTLCISSGWASSPLRRQDSFPSV